MSLISFPFIGSMVFFWSDLFELAFFCVLTYVVLRFAKRDARIFRLLMLCVAVIFGSFLLDCHAAFQFLVTWAPVIGVLGIIFHKEVLQRNYVYAQRQQCKGKTKEPCEVRTLVQLLLRVVQPERSVHVLLEGHDQIPLEYGMHIAVEVDQTSMGLLVQSPDFKSDRLIVIRDGMIRGANCQMSQAVDATWFAQEMTRLAPWQQDAILITKHSDAVVIALDGASRLFSLVAHGKLFEQLHVESLLRMVSAYYQPKMQGGISHASSHDQQAPEH